jgi:hypothetical protein
MLKIRVHDSSAVTVFHFVFFAKFSCEFLTVLRVPFIKSSLSGSVVQTAKLFIIDYILLQQFDCLNYTTVSYVWFL